MKLFDSRKELGHATFDAECQRCHGPYTQTSDFQIYCDKCEQKPAGAEHSRRAEYRKILYELVKAATIDQVGKAETLIDLALEKIMKKIDGK